MLSIAASGYQRYWTNSVPAHSLAGCAFNSARSSVSRFDVALMDLIWRISMPFVPRPTPMNTPGWNLATLVMVSVVAPTGAATLSCGSTSLYGRIDCSYEKPLMTPSDAWVSNWTWWMWMFVFENGTSLPPSLSSLVYVMATQSWTFALIASGSGCVSPAYVLVPA